LEITNYNLSIPQENIWMVENLNVGTNINNVFGIFKIDKRLDVNILKKVMNKIIENNDALRIRIKEENGKPKQYIVNFRYEEVPTYIIDENDEKETNKIINKITNEKFEIIDSKLYDIRIIQNNISTLVCVKTHHIISDAWTLGQIAEEIKDFYKKIKNNEEIEIKPSYLNYIKNEEDYKTSEKYLKDKDFWNEYIKDIECKNEYEITKDKRSKRVIKQLDKDYFRKIEDFCKKNRITEYSFFLSIISVYFSKIFSKNSIVIGTPFLNRRKANKELETLGMFIATLPINIIIDKESLFVDICKNVGVTNLQCYRHSKYPYFDIQKAYQEFSGINTNLYEIAFSYQINKLTVDIDGDVGTTTWLHNNTQANPLLISYVNHFGENLLYYDFILQCFNEKEIEEIHQRLLSMIKQIVDNESIKVNEISILSENDIKDIIKFNNTGIMEEKNDNIIDLFEKIVQKNKKKIAVVCGERRITYEELKCEVNKLAEKIRCLSIGEKNPIAIILDKSIEFIITLLGVLKSGNYYIPILPEEEDTRKNTIIADSDVKAIISNDKYFKAVKNKDIIRIDIEKIDEIEIREKNTNIKNSDLCYLIYTSGTTGKPKGVMMKNENIISLIQSMNLDEDFKYVEGDTSISLLKQSFDASAIDIYFSLLNGGKLVLIEKENELNPKYVVEKMLKEKVTRVFTVHKWIEQIQEICIKNNIKLKNLRIIGTGAEVLKPQRFKRLLEDNPNINLYNTYGPSETTMFITKHKINKEDIKNDIAPIGKLIPNTRAIIVNKNNEIMPLNVKGELMVLQNNESSKNIANGYYRQPAITKDKFRTLDISIFKDKCYCYKTGDIAKINEDRELEFFGRKDDFVKVAGGYLVSINEVEHRIKEILGNIIDVCVISVSKKKTNYLALFILRNERSNNIKVDEIKYLIDENITFYMKPKAIIEINDFPKNKNGKIDRQGLTKIAEEYLNLKKEIIKPRTTLEQMIYDKVKKIVNREFSITDDFEDDLDLDSLSMTALYVELQNSKMTIQDLYNYSSVKDLAYMMKNELISEKNTFNKTDIKIKNHSKKMNIEKVMLTGVTGFVGVNLLKELAYNKKIKKIYCIVRSKIDLTSKERFLKVISEYFNEEECENIKAKSIIFDGDLTREDLGLKEEELEEIKKQVKTIINCAANVKHIGKYSKFYNDNVKTVNNLINICKTSNIRFVPISPLSLHGFRTSNESKIFNENVLNINQSFDKSPYLISKYEAECNIIKMSNLGKINAKIFRIGNIMPRLSDGVFQKNYNQNAFLLAIKEIEELKLQTAEFINSEIFLTPVDECVKAINKIIDSDFNNLVYHIESDKNIKVSNFIKLLKKKVDRIDSVANQEAEEILYKNYNVGVEHLNAIIRENTNEYNNEITIKLLKQLNFKWSELDEKYIRNIIKIAHKI